MTIRNKKVVLILIMFDLFINVGSGQEITGKIINATNEPIDGAAVIVQDIDSTFVEASITDSSGCFKMKAISDLPYRLILQHIAFKTVYREFTTYDVGTIMMEEQEYNLEEFTVIAERPLVRVHGNVLSYDPSVIIANSAAENTHAALLQVPGIMGTENSISLLGANKLHIVINGKMNKMSMEQIISLLKSYPASQIKRIDVMYNAPAKYGFRGAVINVEMIDAGEGSLAGEINTKFTQSYYPVGELRGNMLYSSSKLQLDVLTDYSKGKTLLESNTHSRHLLNENSYEIKQINSTRSLYDRLNFRLGANYDISKSSALSAHYYYNGKWSESKMNAENDYATTIKNSTNDEELNNNLHSALIQYDYKSDKVKFTFGADYLGYRSLGDNRFRIDEREKNEETELNYNSKQSVNQRALFSSFGYAFSPQWDINFGFSLGDNTSHTRMHYSLEDNSEDDNLFKQKEQVRRMYVEASGKITQNISFNAGLEYELFKSDFHSKEGSNNLWDEWTLFPKLSVNYFINQRNILQLNILNNKNYPSYWAVSPLTTYTDSYTTTVGNPSLKPYREYSGQLIYIRNQKYVFILGNTYMPSHFAQLPYQSKEELKTIYRFENYDFSLFTNITAIIPFKIGKWLSARTSFHALRIQDKMNAFYDTSFNNKAYVGALGLNNTIAIPNSPLIFQLNLRYQSPAIQGIYKLGHTFDSSLSCKYNINDNAIIFLQANNLFRDRNPNPLKTDFDGQYSLRKNRELADVSIQFTWKFGNYKSKEHKLLDSARLGKE